MGGSGGGGGWGRVAMALKRSLAGDVPLRRSNPDPVYFQTNIINVHVDLSSPAFTLLN